MHNPYAGPLREARIAVGQLIGAADGNIQVWAGAHVASTLRYDIDTGRLSFTGIVIAGAIRSTDRDVDFGTVGNVTYAFPLHRNPVEICLTTVLIGSGIDATDRIVISRTSRIQAGTQILDLNAGSTRKADIAIGVAVNAAHRFEIVRAALYFNGTGSSRHLIYARDRGKTLVTVRVAVVTTDRIEDFRTKLTDERRIIR